jgi:biopolymer transport protein ExbB
MRRPHSSRLSLLTTALLVWAWLGLALGADGDPNVDALFRQAATASQQFRTWFLRTPPAERVTWGGLIACAALGLGVLGERSLRLRRGRVIPRGFTTKFLDRLRDGKLDRGKAADYCELNPSPASRLAQAAVRRWGRAPGDLERAVSVARQAEVDRLRHHVGTLRRIAALAPLVGLLGALLSSERALRALLPGDFWGPAIADALAPLTASIALAILALVAYDGLSSRVEKLAGDLDRIGAETVDAIVVASIESRLAETRSHPAAMPRTPHHHVRVEIPDPLLRNDPRTRDGD